MAKTVYFQKTVTSSDFRQVGETVVANVEVPMDNTIRTTPAVMLQSFSVGFGGNDRNVLNFGATVKNVTGVGGRTLKFDVQLTLADNDKHSADPASCSAIVSGVVEIEGSNPVAGSLETQIRNYSGTANSASQSATFSKVIVQDRMVGGLQMFDLSYSSDGGTGSDNQIRFILASLQNLNAYNNTLTYDVSGVMEDEPSFGKARRNQHTIIQSAFLAEIATA